MADGEGPAALIADGERPTSSAEPAEPAEAAEAAEPAGTAEPAEPAEAADRRRTRRRRSGGHPRRSGSRRGDAGTGPLAAARRVRAWEPLLVLVAAPTMLLTERLGLWALAAGGLWLAALWTLRRVVDGRWSLRLVIDAPVIALLATVPLAVAAATDRTPAVSRAASLLFGVAVAYAVANAVGTPRRAWRIAAGLLATGAALAVVGALGADWPRKVAVLGAIAEHIPRVLPAIPHAVFGRVAGTAPSAIHPNMLAGLLVPFVPLAAACLAWPRPTAAEPDRRPRGLRALAALCLATALPVVVLTQSRGAWAALALAMAWLGWRWLAARTPAGRMPAAAGFWVAVACLAAIVAGGLWLARGVPMSGGGLALDGGAPTAGDDAGAALAPAGGAPTAADGAGVGSPELGLTGRLALWRASAALLAEQPATGIGLHQFALRFGQDANYGGYIYQGLAHAHNQLLQAALDYGLPGLVAVAGLFAALAVAYHRARRYTAGTAMDPLVVGVAAGLLGHALHGLVDAVAIGAKPGFVVWALVGLMAGARSRARAWAGPPRAAPMPNVGVADAP